MSNRKEINTEIKKLIINDYKSGKSYREIGNKMNLSHATVQYIINKFKSTGSVENLPRSGRPKKFSEREVKMVLREVDKNPRITGPELVQCIATTSNKIVHSKTVRRAVHAGGYASRIPRKKPLISEKNRQLRLSFARQYLSKDVEFWHKVLFTDESKFNLFGNDGKGRIWRKPGTAMQAKNLVSTVKHGGGNLMVWGAIAASGVGKLIFIDGIMDRFYYKNLLEQNLQPSVDCLGLGEDWIFQQDNDPKHTAKIVKEWLLYHAPRQLNFPPQSPDLNPIEHVWELLKRKVGKLRSNSKESLKETLLQAWQEITADVTKTLVESMPRRLQAVIDAKGGPTKY